jgi:hypothetical protein
MMNDLILCHLEWSNAKTDHKNEIRTKKLSRKHMVKVKVNGQRSAVNGQQSTVNGQLSNGQRADVAVGLTWQLVYWRVHSCCCDRRVDLTRGDWGGAWWRVEARFDDLEPVLESQELDLSNGLKMKQIRPPWRLVAVAAVARRPELQTERVGA